MATNDAASAEGKALILVVERDPHDRTLERYFFEQAGYAVEFSDDGAQGLERARVLLPNSIVAEVFRRIERDGVRRVVIDALGDLEKSARDPLRFRDYLYALTQHLATRNITSMLPLETAGTLLGAKGVSGHEVSYMSDNIVLLEMHLNGEMERTIRVIKSRGSAHDGRRHPLRITGTGIVVE